MFDKFGEMDYDGLVRLAKNEKEEGDREALLALAKENGLDEEDAEDYMDGLVETLCTPFMAAAAKLRMEADAIRLPPLLRDWTDTVIEMCMESEGDELCLAVRRPEKNLTQCMAVLIRFAFESKAQIPDAIVNITNVTVNGRLEKMRKPLYLGIPSRADVKRLAAEYYLKG